MECPQCSSKIQDDSHFCRVCGARLHHGDLDEEAYTRAMPRSARDLMIGSTFLGRYRIVEELGRGGMGVVYKAEDTKLKRNVALKFLPPELTRDLLSKERFVHEAQAASALDHPNICIVHEIDETDDGQMFISMGCYDGETLKDRIERGPLEVVEAADIAIQVAEGLEDAHEKGIVHRDIKPSNIIVTTKGQAKVMDFGLAKLAGQTRLTKAGTTMGTIAYMSPEQACGEDIDRRTDIWSLGVVLYELLTGEQPFKGEYDQAVIYSILNEESRPVADINPEIPSEVDTVVGRCLEKAPGDRYQSAGELADDLRKIRKGSSALVRARPGAAPSLGALTRAGVLRVGLPVALVIVAVILFSVLPAGRNALRGLLTPDTTRQEVLRVALLPCDTGEADPEDRAFCDGLINVLTSRLRGIEAIRDRLWIMPVSDVRSLKEPSPAGAWREFGIGTTVGGTMRWQGDVIELGFVRNDVGVEARDDETAEVVRTTRSTPITDPIANLSTWQDTVLLRVVDLLDAAVEPEAYRKVRRGWTVVPAAYESCVRGVGYLHPFRGQEDFDSALRSFTAAIEQDSSYAAAYAWLGKAYMRKYAVTGNQVWADRCVEVCDRALEMDDQMVFGLWVRGEVQRLSGRYAEALETYQRAVDIDDSYLWAYLGMGKTYTSLDSLERAEGAYRKAAEAEPWYYDAHHYLGFICYQQGRYEEAIEPFQRLIDIKPRKTAGYTNLGVVYFQLGRWADARDLFEKSLAIDSTYFVCSNLGTVYFVETRYADAARMYRKALEISEEDYVIWGNLAESYFRIPGQGDEASEHFAKAVAMAEDKLEGSPEDAFLIASLASYYERLERDSEAREFLDEAASIGSPNPLVLFRIAETYEELGDREAAIEWLRKALAEGTPSVSIERFPGLRGLQTDPRYRRLLRELEEAAEERTQTSNLG